MKAWEILSAEPGIGIVRALVKVYGCRNPRSLNDLAPLSKATRAVRAQVVASIPSLGQEDDPIHRWEQIVNSNAAAMMLLQQIDV